MFSLPVLGASCLRLACLLANHLWVRTGGSRFCLDELLHCLLFLILPAVHPCTGTMTGADEALRRSGVSVNILQSLHTEVSQQAVRET